MRSIWKKLMELSRSRFGTWSPTQYKMNIIELDKLKEELDKYADQIAEAKVCPREDFEGG